MNGVAALAIGALEPLLPTDQQCHQVVESDIMSIINNMLHHSTSTTVEPIDDDTLKSMLATMSQKSDSTTDSSTNNSYTYKHIGKINNTHQFIIDTDQLQTIQQQYSASANKQEFIEKLKLSIIDSITNNVGSVVASELHDIVPVVDLSNIEWSQVLTTAGKPAGATAAMLQHDAQNVVDDQIDGDGWQLIQSDDYIRALSEFITETMRNNPAAATQIPPEQLHQMLTDVFNNIKHRENSTNKIWKFGTLVYHTYSWGTTIMQLYNNKLVAQGIYAAASWVLVLLL